MPIALVTALISAGGLVLGSVIGAICSIFINKVSLHEQVRIQRENLNYQENCNAKEKYINANIIRLDFCNAIYQSVRVLQNMDNYEVSYSIPMYKDYHKIIATLCDEYSLKELSYIYQFYGILEINSIVFIRIFKIICNGNAINFDTGKQTVEIITINIPNIMHIPSNGPANKFDITEFIGIVLNS